MADASAADTSISEGNLLGDDADFIDAGEPDGETTAAPEDAATAEPDENLLEDDDSDEDAPLGRAKSNWWEDAQKALSEELEGGDEDAEGEPDGDEVSEDETKGASPRLVKRLRSVLAQSKEKDQTLQQYREWEHNARQQYQTLQQQAQGMVGEYQKMREQYASMQARLEAIERYGVQRPQEQEDYATQFKRETLEEAKLQAESLTSPRIQQLEQQISKMHEASKRQQVEAQRQANSQRILQATEEAVGQNLFPEDYPADIANKKVGGMSIKEVLSNLVLAHSYGTGLPVTEATRHLGEVFKYYTLGTLGRHAQRSGKKVGESQRTSSLPRQGGAPKRNRRPVVSNARAKKHGYKDSLEAAMDMDGLIES